MINFKPYKWLFVAIIIIIGVLILMISVGFTIGFLSEDPDGLERVLIDQNGESWLENLRSPWIPILSWITNDYGAGIIGILLTLGIITITFYLIVHSKKKTGDPNKKKIKESLIE